MKLLIIGVGGFLGAILRYGFSGWMHKLLGSQFPYGTLAVNVVGSFLLGMFLYMGENKFVLHPQMRGFIAIGLLGAFTTFSTFSFETVMLLQENMYREVILNIVLNVILALAAVWLGFIVARSI